MQMQERCRLILDRFFCARFVRDRSPAVQAIRQDLTARPTYGRGDADAGSARRAARTRTYPGAPGGTGKP
jgi:hypothetical protein